jgi:hypothetical protein
LWSCKQKESEEFHHHAALKWRAGVLVILAHTAALEWRAGWSSLLAQGGGCRARLLGTEELTSSRSSCPNICTSQRKPNNQRGKRVLLLSIGFAWEMVESEASMQDIFVQSSPLAGLPGAELENRKLSVVIWFLVNVLTSPYYRMHLNASCPYGRLYHKWHTRHTWRYCTCRAACRLCRRRWAAVSPACFPPLPSWHLFVNERPTPTGCRTGSIPPFFSLSPCVCGSEFVRTFV